MSADTFTPTSFQDLGDIIRFTDVSGNVRQEPRESEACALYLRRLQAGGTALSADQVRLAQGSRVGVPAEETIYSAEVEIQASELLTMQSVPKTLIAAVGAGKKIQPLTLSLFLDFNATAYTDASGASLVLGYRDSAGAQVLSAPLSDFIVAGEDANFEVPIPSTFSAGDDASIFVNQPLVMFLTQALTLGDSPIRAKVTYRIDETGF